MRVAWMFLLALTVALTANADLVSSTGSVSVITPPSDVRVNTGLESSTLSFFFTEKLGFILPSAVNVDITAPGTYNSNASLTAGTIAALTAVNSYYIHTDPVGSATTIFNYDGSVTFDTAILGVIVLDAEFSASNGTLGHATTLYSSGGQGLELFSPRDSVTISGKTLSFSLSTNTAADDIRIITASSVPEPSPLPILLLICLGLCFAVMRKRRVPSTGGRD